MSPRCRIFRASFTIFPSLPSPVIESRSLRRIDNSVGGILGLEVAVDVSEHLAVVPGIRTIVFSNSGRSVFLDQAGSRGALDVLNMVRLSSRSG